MKLGGCDTVACNTLGAGATAAAHPAAEGSLHGSGAHAGGVNSASSLLDSGLPAFGVLLAGAPDAAQHRVRAATVLLFCA